jgi:hypothetical protein
VPVKTRDITLIVIAVVLGGLAIIPSGGDKSRKAAPVVDDAQRTASPPVTAKRLPARDSGKPYEDKGPVTASPADGVPHGFFPLVAGSSWTYLVRGPEDLVPAREWMLKIAKVPEGAEPGILGVGFTDRPQQANIWLDGDTIRLDGLPFVEPLDFLGNRPSETRGVFLPSSAKMSVGSVWNAEYERQVTYHSRGFGGRQVEGPAVATQKDRGMVESFEEVVVPAGAFKAFRVFWLGRVSIAMKGRPVLDGLTAEPYRKDTMWFASGIGMVRRKVIYPERKDGEVVFDLVRYERPAR